MLYISLRQYEYVCAIGRHGGLAAAAAHLNVSQPALSAALTRVESRIGYPLFARRRGAAMTLTPQGRKFIKQAEEILNRAGQLETANPADQRTTRIRLGCFLDLAPFHLAPALHQLRMALPEVKLTYAVEAFEDLLAGMIDGRIDLAITYDLGMDAGFERRKLFDSKPCAIVGHNHPLADAGQVSLADLERYPLILSKEGLSAQHILGLFHRKDLTPNVAHRAASLEIQRSLAAHDEGVGISYASPNNTLSYDGKQLVKLTISDPDTPEAVVLARHGTGPTDETIAIAEGVLANTLRKF